jgi:hypothetical protein
MSWTIWTKPMKTASFFVGGILVLGLVGALTSVQGLVISRHSLRITEFIMIKERTYCRITCDTSFLIVLMLLNII